jgi:hypothetical protein
MVSSGGDPMVFIPAQGRAGGAVPQGQRRHLQSRVAPKPTRPSTARRARPAGMRCSPRRARPTRSTRCWSALRPGHAPDDGGAIHPALEAAHRLHARADGGHPDRQADRHLGAPDRHVPGDPGGRQRRHRRLHHLHADHGQDPRDRGAQADRHAQPHHRRDDPAAGAGARAHRLRRRQDHATFAAPSSPSTCCCCPQDSLLGLLRRAGDLRAGQPVIAIRMALRVDPAEAIGG